MELSILSARRLWGRRFLCGAGTLACDAAFLRHQPGDARPCACSSRARSTGEERPLYSAVPNTRIRSAFTNKICLDDICLDIYDWIG